MRYEAEINRVAELHAAAVELAKARAEAEAELLQEMRRDQDSGGLGDEGLIEVYAAVRGIVAPGLTDRWNRALRTRLSRTATQAAHRDRQQQRVAPNGPNGSWVGTANLVTPAPIPPDGVPVVYVLYDESNEPIYVGSTQETQTRLSTHRRNGIPFVRWMATPCADRSTAYALETRLLREHRLPLNARA